VRRGPLGPTSSGVVCEMGIYREGEKKRVALLKLSAAYFSNAARADGMYRKKAGPFCLGVAEENLFAEIRDSAIEYFMQKKFAGTME
jgi:hypothetical protein